MIVAAYVRFSTKDNALGEARTVARQISQVKAFAAHMGWTLDDRNVYCDDGISGALFDGRPGLQEMLQDAENGEFAALVLPELDRLGRDAENTRATLYKLTDYDVVVWEAATGQALDVTSFEGGIITDMRTRMHEFYRQDVRRKTKRALIEIFNRGDVACSRIYGFDNVGQAKARKRVPNPAQVEVVREIYQRYADGENPSQIAKSLTARGVPTSRSGSKAKDGGEVEPRVIGWAVTTVNAMLRSSAYRGWETYGRRSKVWGREVRKELRDRDVEVSMVRQPEDKWKRSERPELRIIDDAVIARVDARLAAEREEAERTAAAGPKRPQRAFPHYLLSGGLLICPDCGGHFESRFQDKKHKKAGTRVYRCGTARRRPGVCRNGKLMIDADAADAAVLAEITEEVLHPDFIEEILRHAEDQPQDESVRLISERDRLRGEIQNLLQLVKRGVSPDTIAADIKANEEGIRKIEAKLRKPKTTMDTSTLRQVLIEKQRLFAEQLNANAGLARLVVKKLIGPLTLHKEWEMPSWVRELGALPSPDSPQPMRPRTVKWEATLTPDALAEDVPQLATNRGRDGGRRRN